MDDISAAVDRAVSDSTGSSPTTPNDAASTSATASASSPGAPAAGSGFETTASAPTQGDPATTQQAGADDELQDASWGEIPHERRAKILDNARQKEAARVRTELLSRFGLADDDNPDEIRDYVTGLRTDALGTWRKLAQRLEQLGMLRRQGQPAPAPPAVQPATRPQPSYPAQTVDGQTVMLYGPEDIDGLLKWQHQELEKQFAARFAPLEQTQQQLQEHSVKVHAQELAKEEFTVAASWDRFEELRPKIYAEMKADGRRTLESTYNRLYQELVKNERASLESNTRQKLLAEMKKAPVVPNTAVPGATKPTANARRSNSLDTAMDDAVSRALAQHAS